MSRSLHYIHDWTDPKSGHRKRLWIIPAGLGPLARGTVPAWGATSVSSPWYLLPDGCYKVGSDAGEAGYDELPIGQPDSPTRVFRLDLNAFVGDATLEALAGYIVSPVQAGGGDLEWAEGFGSRAFDTTNVFILLSDKGQETIEATEFFWEFCGVQMRQVEDGFAPVNVRDAAGTDYTIEMIYEAKTVHIIRAVLEEVKPRDVRLAMLESGYTVVTRTSIYSTIAETGGEGDADLLVHVYGTVPGGDNRQQFDCYQLTDLFLSIRTLAADVLSDYLRDASVTWTWNDDAGDYGPYWITAKHESAYNLAMERAVAQTGNPVFCGTMRYSETPETISGGWLYDGGDGSVDGSPPAGAGGLAKFETLHTLLHDMCGSVPCKVTYQQAPAGEPLGSIRMNFLRCGDGATNTITPEDARGQRPAPTLRKGIIAGCDCEVAGASGSDVGTVTYTAWGTTEDNRRTVESVFHCQPLIGDIDNRYPIDQTDYDGDLDGVVVGVGQQDLPDGLLLYLDTPTFATRQIAVRIHHNVGVADGYGSGYTYDTINAPTTPIPTVDFGGETDIRARRAVILDEWWRDYRLIAIEIQRYGGIPYATCARVGKLYSHWLQWGVEMTVPYDKALALDLGSIATGITSGNAFLAAGSYLSALGGDPVLLTASTDEGAALATVTLLAPGGT